MMRLPSLIRSAFIFWLLILSIPLLGQDVPDLSETLVDQRIATLRDTGVADTDDALQTYLAVKSWLTRA